MSHGSSLSTTMQHSKNPPYVSLTSQRSQRCCDTGRPVATDPITGSTICSCQVQAGSQAYLTRVPTLPEHIYGSYPAQHPDVGHSAFYPMEPIPAERLTEGYKVPLPNQLPYCYDHLLPANPYGSFPQGFDFNAARRKNATRETTGPLKAWLNEHRKNPYPTKGEKVMLAIITRMTLTQVSTWFANARRRLKKDNIYGENDFDSDDKSSKDDSVSSQNSFTEDNKRRLSDTSGISDISDADIEVDDVTSRKRPTKKCVQRLFSPDIRTDIVLDRIPSPEEVSGIPTEPEVASFRQSPNENTAISKSALLSFESFISLKNTVQDKHSNENGRKENDTNCVNGVDSKINTKTSIKRKVEESDDRPATKKPKIWSISEIIS